MARQKRAELLLSWTTNSRKYSPGDCPERCRERRHRRIQMRRSRSGSTGHYETHALSEKNSLHNRKPPHSGGPEEEEEEEEEEDEDIDDQPVEEFSPPPPARPRLQNPMPVFSSISIKGFAGRMNGKLCVKEDFFRAPEIVGGESLHFFAVYDGDASASYEEQMHQFIAEELTSVDTTSVSETVEGSSRDSSASSHSRQWLEVHLQAALLRSFERMDRVALGACRCTENGYPCACKRICRLAVERSAATVAVLTAEFIVVAHSGVSRAVLGRGGTPIPLSHDHLKVFWRRYVSQRQYEPKRICGVGGRIIPYHNGVRMHGILDTSRQLGNYVVRSSALTSQPEISVTERRAEDECLILASDGVWEVVSNDTACNLATRCLRDANMTNTPVVPQGDISKFRDDTSLLDEEALPSMNTTIDPAALLCRLALGRGSSENMSVIVVNLKRH